MIKWLIYETYKSKLIGLTPEQYELAIKEIIVRLGI
jgi:hypothetical protein